MKLEDLDKAADRNPALRRILQKLEQWTSALEAKIGVDPLPQPTLAKGGAKKTVSPPPISSFTTETAPDGFVVAIELHPDLVGPVVHELKTSATLPFDASTTVRTYPANPSTRIFILEDEPKYVQLRSRYYTSDWNKPHQQADAAAPLVTPGECCDGGGSDVVGYIDDYLEMITRPQQSVSIEDREFNSTLMQFDPDDYDNVDWYIEAEAENDDSVDRDLILTDGSTEIYRLAIPAGTTGFATVYANSGLPLVGILTAGLYRLQFETTTNNNELRCQSFKIRFRQYFPTKTRLQKRMLVGGAISNQDTVLGESRFVIGGDTGYLLEDSSATFEKILDGWDVATEWTLESIAGNTGSLGVCHCYVALWNIDSDLLVAENDHTTETSTTALMEEDFLDSATNFDVGSEFRIYSRGANATQANNTLILGVRMYVRVTGINAATNPL